MPDEQLPVNASNLDVKAVLKELEVPFSSSQVQWRVTRIDPKVLEGLLAKVQAPPLAEIGNMKTLRDVVLGLEQLADSGPVLG